MAQQADARRQVLVCGGGNGAHVFAGLAAADPNNKVHWLSLYADEAERINKSLADKQLTVDFSFEKREVKSKPALVTNDPAKAVPGTTHAIICVPSYAHKQYLDAIAKYSAEKHMVISAYPSGCGFEVEYTAAFGAKESQTKAEDHTLALCFTLPWACRFKTYGEVVEVMGSKECIEMSVGGEDDRIEKGLAFLQSILGKKPVMEADPKMSVLGSTMGSINPIVHPPMMWGKWKDWSDKSEPMKEAPLFYEGISDEAAAKMIAMCDDIRGACKEINNHIHDGTHVEVQKIAEWYLKTYGPDSKDTSSMAQIIRTNPGYQGLVHPCKKLDDGRFVPNFGYRYLTEDIPYGLVVVKGYAVMAGAKTPVLDQIIRFGEEKLGKDYLGPDGDMNGKDIKETRAPQAYNLTLADVLHTFEKHPKKAN